MICKERGINIGLHISSHYFCGLCIAARSAPFAIVSQSEAGMTDQLQSPLDGASSEHQIPAIDATVLRRSLKTIMKPAITFAIDTPISQAIFLMQTKRIGCVLVTSRGKLLGIFTERDVLMRVVGVVDDTTTATVGQYMTPNPVAVRAGLPIAHALHLMSVYNFRHLPLVDDNKRPIGIISFRDVVRHLRGTAESDAASN